MASMDMATAQTMQWNKTYGGTGYDYGYSIIQAPDGYVIAGYTDSYGNGSGDVYLVKTDYNGTMQWNKTYGGTGEDRGYSIIQAPDGYVIAGYTDSYGNGSGDVYLVKVGDDASPSTPPHVVITIDLGPMSDSAVIYEDGLPVRTVAGNITSVTPTPTPSVSPGVSPTMTPTPTPSVSPTPTPTPISSAMPTAGNGMNTGLVIVILAVIVIAAGGAYYLFKKK
jgi:hypothetical protein